MDLLGLDKPWDWRDALVKLQEQIAADLGKYKTASDMEQRLNALADVVSQQVVLQQMTIAAMLGGSYRDYAEKVNAELARQGLPRMFDVPPQKPPA